MEVGKAVMVLLAAILAVAPRGIGAQDLDPTATPASSTSNSQVGDADGWECPTVVLIDSEAGLAVLRGGSGLSVSAAGETIDDLGLRLDEVLHDRVLVTPIREGEDSSQYWLYVSRASQPAPCTRTSRTFAKPLRVDVESRIIVVPDSGEAEGSAARIVTLPPPDEPRPDAEEGENR